MDCIENAVISYECLSKDSLKWRGFNLTIDVLALLAYELVEVRDLKVADT